MQLKNIVLISLLASLMVCMDSCNKNAALVYTGAKIATVQDCLHGVTYTYNYNSSGAIASIVQSYNSQNIFTYTHDSIVSETETNLGIVLSGMVYLVNSQTLADSATGIRQLSNSSWSYSFDAGYYPMQINHYTYGVLDTVHSYNIVGKNISYIEHIDTINHTRYYDYYDYYASNGNTLGNQAIGENFLGVQTANLIEHDIILGSSLSDTIDYILYKYRYDTSARPDTLATYHRNSGEMIDSFIYTYTD